MLYILLIIIAVGVLLASEGGQKLLGLIIILFLIGGLLYAGFWIVIITIGIFSDKDTRDVISGVIASIFWFILSLCILSSIYTNYKEGKFTKKSIKCTISRAWRTNKILFIFICTSLGITIMIVLFSLSFIITYNFLKI